MLSRTITIIFLGLSVVFSPFVSGDDHDAKPSVDAGIQAADSGARPRATADLRRPWRGFKLVALTFVGHGEPTTVKDGDVPIAFPDGSPFGPHGVELGVPEAYQYAEWGAAYEEIATALSHIFGDLNVNGEVHELGIVPKGDVPDFFTWDAFHASIYSQYDQCDNYSPHNDRLREHVDSLRIRERRARFDIYLALLDEVPRIPDVVYEIANRSYDELVVVPMLVSTLNHSDPPPLDKMDPSEFPQTPTV